MAKLSETTHNNPAGTCTCQANFSDVLCIGQVAALLHCAVDTIRRIPVNELPIYRVGRSNLYLRDEVIRYLRTRRVQRTELDHILDDIFDSVGSANPGDVESEPVDAPGRSSRRAP